LSNNLKSVSWAADTSSVGPVFNVLFGAGVGVTIVLGFWQLAYLADELYQRGRDESRAQLRR